MSLELFMLDGVDRIYAIRKLERVVERMPEGFFNRVHICSPWEINHTVIHGIGPAPVNCHYANIAHGNLPRFNRWCLQDLPALVEDDHFMIIHRDGFPLNATKWSDEFLQYDYIGAPWPAHKWTQSHRVGNGGFCIRSRRLAQWAANQPFAGDINEDIFICCRLHDRAIAEGFKYAPLPVAARFSLEAGIPEFPGRNPNNVFGFHGPQWFKSIPNPDYIDV
jgi:hypothetical protein